MGLLGDIFSEIDRKKRQLKGLLSDPAETIYQGIRNFGADQQGLLDTQAQAYPMIATPEQKKRIAGFARTQDQAKKELADAGAAQGMAAATVWHGSPHKFDKFDSSKIGTGEGAQAYGHGLYLADNKGVANMYADTLGANKQDTINNAIDRVRHIHNGDVSKVRDSLISEGISPQEITPDLVGTISKIVQGTNADGTVTSEALRQFKTLETLIPNSKQLYKVDLPDEHIAKMLDWDKPLSQQPEAVKALRPLADRVPGLSDALQSFELGSTKGQTVNDYISRSLSPDKAAKMFRDAGIPGIRYLDGGSRGAGTGTSNYVVFPGNEDILKILERNGQGLLGP